LSHVTEFSKEIVFCSATRNLVRIKEKILDVEHQYPLKHPVLQNPKVLQSDIDRVNPMKPL